MVFNQNNFSVDISNWKIIDTQGSVKSYTFPQNTIIKAKSFLLFLRPQTKITLNNDADGLNLIQPNGTITDSVIYTKAKLNQSYNRMNNNWTWSSTLTPGWKNIVSDTENSAKENSVENAQFIISSLRYANELELKRLFVFLIFFKKAQLRV